jgi:heterodisulfide reductase subunit A-like polyferredoxin
VISPKLVEVGRHINIDLLTNSELLELKGEPGNFTAVVRKNPRFIDLDKCTSCGECAKVCPIETVNDYDEGLSRRKAAFKQYQQAMPGAFAISKRGTAPCKATCPAHVSVQGYIALINQGKYREALELFRDDHPFPGVCGRVCHHPCEKMCTRNDVDQPLAIRELHRFLFDTERSQGEPVIPPLTAEKRGEKVAVIGAGPAGLAAAYSLARRGYPVTVFEKLPVAGGMMAVGIPAYRLPRDILNIEIEVVRRLGVEIRTGVTFGKDVTLESLKTDGYKAVFLAVGLHGGRRLGVENEDAPGVLQGVDFLRDAALGKKVAIGPDVLVIGGGNVAVDVALTAKRLGAKNVTMVCLEKREEMPAWAHEIQEALESDVTIVNSFGPKAFFIDKSKRVSGLEFKTCTAVFDENKRFNPKYDESVCTPMFADTVIVAIGQSTDRSHLDGQGIAFTRPGGIQADPVTLQTPIEWVFAGGDVHHGPKSVVEAVASGKEAAESIHRYINRLDLREGRAKEWEHVKPDTAGEAKHARVPVRCLDPAARECNFLEVSFGYDETEARMEAQRCLKCGICSECYQCVKACLAKAVDHSQREEVLEIPVGSVILCPGSDPYDPSALENVYHYTSSPNVLTSLEFERILSATGPTMGHLKRLSDDREPKRIAWLQCIGSRDNNQCGNGYCSSVCCMYAMKDAMIAKEHQHGDLDCTIFNMDIRSFGKDYEKYYNRAIAAGVRFVRSRVHSVDVLPETGNLSLRYVDEAGGLKVEEYDMVVLSVGLQISKETVALAERLKVDLNPARFALNHPFAPVETSRPGVYACGVFQGPKDIPSSVTEAGAAAVMAAGDLAEARGRDTVKVQLPEELDVAEEAPRVGVFVCNCGINIGGVVDVPAVRAYAEALPHVVYADENLFTCSQDTQEKIKEKIKEHKLNRVVVASCSPKTHAPMFMETLEACGLNPYLFEMANIRNQDSWVHSNDREAATRKAKDLVRMSAARAATLKMLRTKTVPIHKQALVIGGGVAGMNAALGLARQGFPVVIVEKEAELGGFARRLHHTIEGADVPAYLKDLAAQMKGHPHIRVLTAARITAFEGFKGNFVTTVAHPGEAEPERIPHGVIVVATGAGEYRPTEYLYGQDPRVMTQVEFGDLLERPEAAGLQSVVMIQCVGSRNETNVNCSRICCQNAVKNALALKTRNPDAQVYVLYRDIRTYGLLESYYTEARKQGVIFIRFDPEAAPRVAAGPEGVAVTVKDHVLQREIEITADRLVLSAGMAAADTADVSAMMKLNRNPEGFFIEAHVKLRPVDMPSEGVFLCGTAHGPKLISETIAQAQAAAARASTLLSKDSIKLSAITAKVDPEQCVKCLTCVRSCPFGVPQFNVQEKVIEINEALCRGCGVCTAVCPRQTINLSFYEDDQIVCKIDALLNEKVA